MRLNNLSYALMLVGYVSIPTLAQTPPASSATGTTKVEKIEVTGSNIKRIDGEAATPVTVITREEIERQGINSVAELLRTLPNSSQVGGVLSDLTGNTSFSGGASSANLRGLGAAATLVLLNGRRLAPHSLANPNFQASNFVNVDSLPLSVIDRVEILRDGASAIYGSDAVAGVINFITRKDFTGGVVSATVSQNRDSEYHTRRGVATFGFGDLAKDRFNLFGNVEILKREETRFRDVEAHLNWNPRNRTVFNVGNPTSTFAGNIYRVLGTNPQSGLANRIQFVGNTGTCASAPGTVVNAAGQCIFDQWQGTVVAPNLERAGVFVRGVADLNANTSLFAELSYSKNETNFTNNPQVYGADAFGPYYQASTGRSVAAPDVLPVGHPSNPYSFPISIRHRFHEMGPTKSISKDDAVRVVLGARWTVSDWDTEFAYNDSQNSAKLSATNVLSRSRMIDAVTNGGYNFINPSNSRLKPSDLALTSTDVGDARSQSIDAKASRDLMRLPAGALALALGFEHRREKFSTKPDEKVVAGDVVGRGASSADGSRSLTAMYGELSVPVLKSLEMQLALRADRYSDYGQSTTPKVSALWTATRTLKLRGSYSQGFRAPSLNEISKASTSAFQNGFTGDRRRCSAQFPGNPINPPGNLDCTNGYGFATIIEASPNLEAETSKSYAGGFVWEPFANFSTTVDFYQIIRKNEVTTFGVGELITNETSNDPRYAGRIVRDVPDTDGRPGRILTVRNGYFNTGGTNVQGIDMDISYRLNLGNNGRITFTVAGSHFLAWKGQNTDGSWTDFSGVRTVPRTRATFVASWRKGDWTVTPIWRHVGSMFATTSSVNPCNATVTDVCRVNALTTLDATVQYTGIKNLAIRAGMTNITRKNPPWQPNATNGWNPVLHTSALFGQVFSLSGEYRFK
jgi:iron complex outermembrane receptor protein